MADSAICLEIHDASVVAVGVERTSKGGALVTGFLRVESSETEFSQAIERVQQHCGADGVACSMTLGAEMFSFRRITLPFTERKKLNQVLPMELADLIPGEIDSCLMEYVVKNGPDGAEILVALIRREILAERLAAVEAAGMIPVSVGISGLDTALAIADRCAGDVVFLDIGDSWTTLFLIQEGRPALIRTRLGKNEKAGGNQLAEKLVLWVQQTLMACRLVDLGQPEFHVFAAGIDFPQELSAPTLFGREVQGVNLDFDAPVTMGPGVDIALHSDVNRALALFLKRGQKNKTFNFYKDEFRKTRSLHDYRQLGWKIVVPMIFCSLVAAVYFGYEYRQLVTQQDQLKSEIEGVFKETLPEMTRIVNPVRQLQAAINEIKKVANPGGTAIGRYTVIDILSELSARIPDSYSVKIVRMVADMETIRFKATTSDFNTVDNVQKALQKSAYFNEVVISSANQVPQGNEVNFEMKLGLAGE